MSKESKLHLHPWVYSSSEEGLAEKRNPPSVIEELKRLERMREDGVEIVVGRNLFGESSYGEKIYQWILAGSPCETIVDEEQNRCGIMSLLSIDYDDPAFGSSDSKLVCSLGHGQMVRDGVTRDLRDFNGMTTGFGINGFGRWLVV